jgi:putative membrane protein
MSKQIGIVAFLTIIGMSVVMGTGCSNQHSGNANNGTIAKSEPAKPPSDAGDKVVTGGDLAFMNDAAPGGMAEVEMGRMAVEQAASSEVKQFGQRMVDDHSKAGEELKQLAQQKKVMLPAETTPKQKETMDKLSKLKGMDFDREYVKGMVADHEKDVAAFEAVAKNGTDADVKAFAAKTLPTLKEHLQMIQTIAAKMGLSAKP